MGLEGPRSARAHAPLAGGNFLGFQFLDLRFFPALLAGLQHLLIEAGFENLHRSINQAILGFILIAEHILISQPKAAGLVIRHGELDFGPGAWL